MANPLTGDYEAVLEVSGSTVNRLMASIHQSAGANPALPSFPHNVGLRLGDDRVIDAVKGSMWVQVGVPQVRLVDHASDYFVLGVEIRARYVPDPDTEPLAEFIEGNVSAEYRLEDIDPNCWGYGKNAADYLWFRVVDESVIFHGTAYNDTSGVGIAVPIDEAAVIQKINHQLKHLLETRFIPTPQHVTKQFRRGSMLALDKGLNETAVAVPLALDGGPAAGQLDSVDQVILDGHDFAVGVSAEYIMAQVQAELDNLKASFGETIHFHSQTSIDLGPLGGIDILTVDITWAVSLTKAEATWTGGTVLGVSGAVITVSISGQGVTQKSEYNFTFDVTQSILVTFRSGIPALKFAAAGSPTVTVTAGGVFSGLMESKAKPVIQNAVAANLQAYIDAAAGQFDLKTIVDGLSEQLRKVDDQGGAGFEGAQFSPDGIVMFGTIWLTPRRDQLTTFEKTPERDAFTAYHSWIPGGHMARFEWTWNLLDGGGSSGAETFGDRFLLRRPWTVLKPMSKFGVPIEVAQPLPGLDGSGIVCLNVTGFQVDEDSGELVPVQKQKCTKFGWVIGIKAADAGKKLFLRDWAPEAGNGPRVEQGLIAAGGTGVPMSSANTLVVHTGERWSEETAAALRDGLAACKRNDAGLLVLVLFREGVLSEAGRDPSGQLSELAGQLEAPLVVNEDVHGGWSSALAIRGDGDGPSWRLVGPSGGVTWMRDGAIAGEELGRALDGDLVPSPGPTPELVRPDTDIGAQLNPIDLVTDDRVHCPPPPLSTPGRGPTKLTFGRAGSESSDRHIRGVAREHGGDDDSTVLAVIDGASAGDAERFMADLGGNVLVIPDPEGQITERFGIRYWPTTLTVSENGRVIEHEAGA